jgi:hypothetical protein
MAGGQTDLKLTVTILNFENAPKNCAFFGREFNFFYSTVIKSSDYFPTQHYTRFVHALSLDLKVLTPPSTYLDFGTEMGPGMSNDP